MNFQHFTKYLAISSIIIRNARKSNLLQKVQDFPKHDQNGLRCISSKENPLLFYIYTLVGYFSELNRQRMDCF